MGDHRHLFRFKLPWLSAASSIRPVAQRPAVQTEAPSQPTTSIPIQRPPFRPAGSAPRQTTPTQAKAPSEKTHQPSVTSRPATETRVTSQTRSPSRVATQARAVSVPPSPSRIVSQPQSTAQAVSKQQSLSPPASQPAGQTSPQPSSSRQATLAQTPSPPNKFPTAIQEKSQPPGSTRPPSSASQQTQPFGVAAEPSHASAEVKEVAPISGGTTEKPSAPVKPKERAERKEVVEQRGKLTAKGSTHEQSEQRTTTKVLAATDVGTKTREQVGTVAETGKRHQQRQEGMGKKETLTASSTDEKQIKTVTSVYPKGGSMPTNAQQKPVSSNWEQVPLHKETKEDISKFVHKLTTEQPNLSTEEKSISVLTLAGENRGASFHVASEPSKKDGSVHIHRGYKINPDDSPDATTDGEESSRGRKPIDSVTKENPASITYANNNTQSINNSVVFESSVNARNPGLHMKLLHNLIELTESSSAKAEHVEPRKTEFKITPADKLTYEPTIRRRCLRGLFAESSDSDPGNPEKPRRHGCRYSCGGKNKQKEEEIF